MDKVFCQNCQNFCEYRTMPDVRDKIIEQIPEYIWTVGDGRGRGETYDRMLDRAARKTGIPYARLWAYWYRKVRKPLAEEYVVLRHWAALRADAETIRLMAETERSKKDAADARSNTDLGTGSVQLDVGSLFGDSQVSI